MEHRRGLFAGWFRARDEHAAINHPDRTGLRLVNGCGDFLDVRPNHRPVDRGHNQHRERPSLKALLVFHVLVAGEEHVKPFFVR